MKKLWLFPLLCILLCGCGGKAWSPEEALRSAGEITLSTEDVTTVVTFTEEGCVFRFTAPETLKRLTVCYDGKELTATYGTLETRVPGSFLGKILPAYHLLKAFREETAAQGGENIRKITLDEREFLLYYDSESEKITRLEVKGADGTLCYDVLSYIETNDDTESTGTDPNP